MQDIDCRERALQSGNEWQDKTEWHNVVLWAKLAEVAGKYPSQGSKVYVEGRLQTRSWDFWDDQQSGQKRYMTEVIASDLIMLVGVEGGEDKSEPGAIRKRGMTLFC